MNLVAAVTNILNRKVSEAEAKDFALNQYGVLCAYIRSEQVKEIIQSRPKKTELKKVLGTKSKKIHKNSCR